MCILFNYNILEYANYHFIGQYGDSPGVQCKYLYIYILLYCYWNKKYFFSSRFTFCCF